MSQYCEKCGKTMNDTEFYTSNNTVKYPPNGKLNMCKKCITMHVDNWEPETFKWILEEVDVPYIKAEWDKSINKFLEKKDASKMTGMSILGNYISKMKLNQWKDKRWVDGPIIEEEMRQEAINAMKMQGKTDEEIAEALAVDHGPQKPAELLAPQQPEDEPEYVDPSEIPDEFSDQLTDEDKKMLRLKWGRGYTCEQWVRMEQLYNDFENSYDIQTAGHKDTLIMVCKASLKANELMDAGDIDASQKMTRVYDALMKSGNFQGVQNKNTGVDGIDSVGEIVRMCEKEGFIPRYYIDKPKDRVDQILTDLQHYTHKLVTEELNLGNMIEAAVAANLKDQAREQKIVIDDAESEDEVIVDSYEEDNIITDDDYREFAERQEELRKQDEEAFNHGS